MNLDTNIQYIKGVGPKRAALLNKLGIFNINDLIHYYPREWLDRRVTKKIKDIKIGERVTIYAKVVKTESLTTRRGIRIFKALLQDETGTLWAVWFRKYSPRFDTLAPLKKNILIDKYFFITGDLDWESFKVSDYELAETDTLHSDKIIPLYNCTENLDNKFLRKIIYESLEAVLDYVEDFMPQYLLDKYNMLDIKTAICNIHFPLDWEHKNRAYFRLAFGEFFLMLLVIMSERKKIIKQEKHHNYTLHKNLLTTFRENLGFEFTIDQKKVINEIFSDMQSHYPMNRLLQGDVGSGKTVVALSAMLLACENDYQAMLMAPTEVLAEQHFISISRMVKDLGVRVECLKGSTRARDRRYIYGAMEKGLINILVGTHALLNENLNALNLKLIVIDEQHRFGVYQRMRLMEKSEHPDVLVMTATPIPRTLALTAYGDLDVSTIKVMPKGRKPIDTRVSSQLEALMFLKKEILAGRQGYIVYPAVEESELIELKSVTDMYEKLSQTIFKDIPIAMLHGRMNVDEKQSVMRAFSSGEIKVLIATTVIEVGIDVPNSTVMVIEHSDRFGLSTLHQLRGRVGRGEHQSYCFLISESKTDDARKRLSALVNSNDGFVISEEDLAIRGPGDFLGKDQHGFLELGIGSLINDTDIIQKARREVEELLDKDPGLLSLDRRLLTELDKRYKDKKKLMNVG